MSKHRLRNIMIALAVVLPLAQAMPVSAWGPERPLYTMKNPADHPTFNSITDNSSLGDERDFVRIVERDSGNTFTSDLEIEAGKEYVVMIYYHNNASATYNDAAHDYVGVAEDTNVVSYFPEKLKAGEKGKIDGMISASNSDPESVWDEAYITAKDDMTIGYVKRTARIYNDWATSGTELGTDLFTPKGAFIGLDELDGLILGCEEFSGAVHYNIRTIAEGDPIPDDVEILEVKHEEPTSQKENPEETNNRASNILKITIVILGIIIVILSIVIMKLIHRRKQQKIENQI